MYADCLKQTLGAEARSDGVCREASDPEIVAWLGNIVDENKGCSTTEDCRQGCAEADDSCSKVYCWVHPGASYCAVPSSGTNLVSLCEEATNDNIGG